MKKLWLFLGLCAPIWSQAIVQQTNCPLSLVPGTIVAAQSVTSVANYPVVILACYTLSATNFTIDNGTSPPTIRLTGVTGGITQLTGDGTAGPGTGSQAITLATVNASVGTCGDSTHIPVVVLNAKGLVTACTSTAVTGFITSLTGDVTGSGSGAVATTLATVNANTGSCGDATHVCQPTFDGKGRATAAASVAITHGINQLTGDATAGPGDSSQVLTFATVNANVGTCGDATHVGQATFNAKGLATGCTAIAITHGINQLTGDGTAGAGDGSQAFTLATVNANTGVCGDATHVCQPTFNGKGLATAAAAVAITHGINQLTGDVTAGAGDGSQAATLATVNANVGVCGSAAAIPTPTLNGKGLATACTTVINNPCSTFGAQTDAATVTWAIGSSPCGNASLTFTVHSGSRTLNITGPVNGGSYVLWLKQDATGGEGLTLGTGCTWKVSNGGAGAITPSVAANAIDVLAFTYDGTNCYANFNKNFN